MIGRRSQRENSAADLLRKKRIETTLKMPDQQISAGG